MSVYVCVSVSLSACLHVLCLYGFVCVCVCMLSTYNGALAHERFMIQMRKFDLREGLEPTTSEIPS